MVYSDLLKQIEKFNVKIAQGKVELVSSFPSDIIDSVGDYEFVISSHTSVIMEARIKAEENIINQVLTAYLKRDPTEDDYKRCTVAKPMDVSNYYFLAYDSAVLGKVSFNPDAHKIGYTFTPLNN